MQIMAWLTLHPSPRDNRAKVLMRVRLPAACMRSEGKASTAPTSLMRYAYGSSNAMSVRDSQVCAAHLDARRLHRKKGFQSTRLIKLSSLHPGPNQRHHSF
jgi:hypothetical protein